MKDGFSFKAELQYKTTSDRYKARKKGASLVAQTVENLPAMQETWVQSSVGKIPWRREWQPTPTFLPRESHGQGSQACYSPWGFKESDTNEQLTHRPHKNRGKKTEREGRNEGRRERKGRKRKETLFFSRRKMFYVFKALEWPPKNNYLF